MQTKRIICPKCNAVLDVNNTRNEEEKQITCPSCKAILKVRFHAEQKPIEAKTFPSPQQKQPDKGETQLAGCNYGETQLSSELPRTQRTAELMFGGISYQLDEGHNVVGRKGTTSHATVQIETADRYMSRQHSIITVTTQSDGTIKVVLSNYQNKNMTLVDGQEIRNGDTIRLTDGNCITMGHTTLTFKLS